MKDIDINSFNSIAQYDSHINHLRKKLATKINSRPVFRQAWEEELEFLNKHRNTFIQNIINKEKNEAIESVDPHFLEHINKYINSIDVVKTAQSCIDDINTEIFKTSIWFRSCILKGSIIGGMIDGRFSTSLGITTNWKWGHGIDTKDVDCVCYDNHYYNTELKTTCTERGNGKQVMIGSKTQACTPGRGDKYSKDDYKFYIFIGLHKSVDEGIRINEISVGMLKPTDWVAQKENDHSGSARVPASVVKKQFLKIYDHKWVIE